MKLQILMCQRCSKETPHRVSKRLSSKGRSERFRITRTVSHCNVCGLREINNTNAQLKKGKYKRDYKNEVGV